MTAAPEPPAPRRGRGRPRKLPEGTGRTTVRFPPELLDEMTAEAAAAGRSLNDEIIARCRATQETT